VGDYIGFGGAFLFASLSMVVAYRQPTGDPKRRADFALSALLADYGMLTMLHRRALIFKLVVLLPLALFALICAEVIDRRRLERRHHVISQERAERIARAHACIGCKEYTYRKVSVRGAPESLRADFGEAWHASLTCGVCGVLQELGIDGDGDVIYAV